MGQRAVSMDFNSYLQTNYVVTQNKMQSFAMCPPSYFLRSVSVRTHNGAPSDVVQIQCSQRSSREGERFNTYTRSTREQPAWNHPREQVASCPFGQAASGIKLKAGDVTYGFSLRCKELVNRWLQ